MKREKKEFREIKIEDWNVRKTWSTMKQNNIIKISGLGSTNIPVFSVILSVLNSSTCIQVLVEQKGGKTAKGRGLQCIRVVQNVRKIGLNYQHLYSERVEKTRWDSIYILLVMELDCY